MTTSSGLHYHNVNGLGHEIRFNVRTIMLITYQNAIDVCRIECGPSLRHHFCSLGDPEI